MEGDMEQNDGVKKEDDKILYEKKKKPSDQRQRGAENRLRGLSSGPGKGYARVPSRGTISASTTSTSLVTDYTGSHLHLPRTLFPQEFPSEHYEEEYLEEEEKAQHLRDEEERSLTEEPEDFEDVRQYFQQKRQISLGGRSKYKMEMEVNGSKDKNLRNSVPYVKSLSNSGKIKDFTEDASPFKPTTQKLYIGKQLIAAITMSLGSLVVGYCIAYTSPALTTMIHENSTIAVTRQEGSWVGSLMPLAALVGGVIGGPLIENFGRKNTIFASTSFPFIISWIIIATASNVSVVYVGRIVGGLCVGIGSLSCPVYLGEIIQAEVRGQLGLLPTAFGNIGILVCFVAGKYLDWSELAWLGAILPVPLLVLMMLIPETPRWLVSHNRARDARNALQWLRGKEADVDAEFNDIVKSYRDAEQNVTGSIFRELLKSEFSKTILISLGLMFFQQLSGIYAVIFYTVNIFKDAGSTIDENLSTIIVGIVNFGSTFIAAVLIEHLGRKILLYISGVMMIVTLGTLGTFFYVRTLMDVSAFGWVPLVSFVVYVIGFSLGFGPIPWLMMGEILPGRIRSTAASVATAFNWSCTFLVTKTFNDILESIGAHGTFWMFGVICVFAMVFTYFWVPETKGKTLEEIEKKLSGRKSRADQLTDINKLSIGC